MQAVLSLVQADALGAQVLMRPFAVTGLVSLTSPHHLAATASWPHSSDEGIANAQSILSLVASILHNPFLPGAAPDSLVKELQEVTSVPKNSLFVRIVTHAPILCSDLLLSAVHCWSGQGPSTCSSPQWSSPSRRSVMS